MPVFSVPGLYACYLITFTPYSAFLMILTDKEILAEIEKGNIVIEPYDRACLGTNSYDVHLGKYLAT